MHQPTGVVVAGVCLVGVCSDTHQADTPLHHTPWPPLRGQSNACENITFLAMRSVKMLKMAIGSELG